MEKYQIPILDQKKYKIQILGLKNTVSKSSTELN